MEDHLPGIFLPYEHIGRLHRAHALEFADACHDIFDTGHDAEVVFFADFNFGEDELHAARILKNRLPAIHNGLPAGYCPPAWMNAANELRIEPYLPHRIRGKRFKRVVEGLIGQADFVVGTHGDE